MKNLFLNHAWLASLILYGFTSLMPAKAQPAWPAAKPIRVIVNFPLGGAADLDTPSVKGRIFGLGGEPLPIGD